MHLSSIKNEAALAVAIIQAAMNALAAKTSQRIVGFELEDGSGSKFNFTTYNYETPTWARTIWFVAVEQDFRVRITLVKSEFKNLDGDWVLNSQSS